MKNIRILPLIFLALAFLSSCEKDETIDLEKPVIDLSIPGAFPVNCDTLYFGESFEFNVLFSDNAELGSFSIDIHNNFDHHSHSTEVTECDLDPMKEPVNPFLFIEDYAISEEVNELETNRPIFIPAGDDDGLYDEGDYHFFISLTDKEGWSDQIGLSIKILHR
jgi:hypothetical protein